MQNEMQGMGTDFGIKNNPSITSILSELMRDQLLQVVRTAEMKQMKVIENYIDGDTLKAVINYIKIQKTCETFDVVNALDYNPKEICKILDRLKVMGKIKSE